MIRVDDLAKTFRVHRRPPGLRAAIRSVFRRNYEIVRAVDGVTFAIEPGERVGFLGPNGAGKTTTLKVLSGLLHPTSGTVRIDDFDPSRRERDFLRRITLVMGQKNQLIWDLPPSETFALNRALFGVDSAEYTALMAELSDLLDLGAIADKPSRQLSLGERMKCELAAALLHRPKVLFLDEPTIGLDVSMQVAIREFIRSYNQRFEASVLLTSHYMQDVTALCSRVIVIDKGKLIYDGDLRALAKTMDPGKLVSFTLTGPVTPDRLSRMGEVIDSDGRRVVIRVHQDELHSVVGHALSNLPITDLGIQDPPLEHILQRLFGRARDADPGEGQSTARS